MFSSKIIKHKDRDKNGVRTFCLKQLPSDNDQPNTRHGKHRDGSPKKNADPGHDMLARAQHEAHVLVESARREAARIQQQAHEQGRAEGIREGRAQAEAELASCIAALRDMQEGFAAIKQAFYDDHRDVILEIALKIARMVIHQETIVNRELVVQMLTAAIKLAMDRERLKVRVNPDDLTVCIERRPDILKIFDGIKQIMFEPDETVAKGGALIEYAFGEIDARVDQQFAEIERGLRSAHGLSQDMDGADASATSSMIPAR